MRKPYAVLRTWIGIPLSCATFGLLGCSTARPPTAAMAQADLAVRQANDSKAPTYAPDELRSAREKLLSAQQAVNADEYERARRLAEQATVDAQLAQAKGAAGDAQHDVTELRRTIDALSAEATRPAVP